MLSASNIKGKNFSTVKNGFDPEEVDSFLVQTASDYAALEKQNLDQADEIERLKAELEQYKADEEAIRSSLVLAHKESAKIIADAKAQSKQMLDSAKSEQVRLSEQSAAECERIVKEHKAKCAELIQQNTDITERKLDEIRAAYDEELEAYENLQAEVTYFKANLTELYNKQIRLVMELPTMTPEELEEFEASLDELENEEYYEEEPAPVQEEPVSFAPEEPVQTDEPFTQGMPNSENIDKILQTGSFDPVIPKSNFNDLQFGKNN
ncbi:MAG: DivIVA domain-containing protein [Ruminococcus sp.]|jgi:cell division initiation protein|nr:DivIVA domain-containing protein [Ruminococcus sp.]MBR2303850.1 DivIVA domain-containing protein [Ruminococcus sp.]